MSAQQIEDLQVRLTHQEAAIDALNRTVARQDRLIVELRERLAEVQAVLRDLRASPLGDDPGQEPPPPHY